MPMWVCIAFESEIKDPRDILRAEYDGVTMYIRPNMDEADQIAVFCRLDSDSQEVRLKVNRFLSAMAWKDGVGYRALGSGGAGAPIGEKVSCRRTFSGAVGEAVAPGAGAILRRWL